MNPVERLLGAVINPVVDAVDVDGVVAKVDVDRLVNEVDLNAVLEKLDLDALLTTVDLDALIGRIDLNALIGKIDLDALIDKIDLNALIGRIDVNRLIAKVDLNALLDQIDLNKLLAKVDLDRLLAELDLDALLEKVDLDALLEKVDLNTLLAKVDLDPLLQQVDVAGLAKRAGIDDIVADATRGTASRLLALARRQVVALDLIATGIVARLTRRPRPEAPTSASPTGLLAGAVSRLLAYFVDMAVITTTFGVVVSVATYLVQLVSGGRLQLNEGSWGWPWLVGYAVFWFLYWVIGLTIAGSSLGKALLGIKVRSIDGDDLRGRQALVRTLVYPFSFVLGLGLLPIVFARSHRALHDRAARTEVRYDWGDTAGAERTPLAAWLRKRSPSEWRLDEPPVPARTVAAARPAHAPAPADSNGQRHEAPVLR